MKKLLIISAALLAAGLMLVPVGAGHNKVPGWVITRTAAGNILSPILVEPEELNAPLGKFSCRETKRQLEAIGMAHKRLIGQAEAVSAPTHRDKPSDTTLDPGTGGTAGGSCGFGDPQCATCWTPIWLPWQDPIKDPPADCRDACTRCWAAN